MRQLFLGAYPTYIKLPGLFSKCWWCNQEKGEFGALYISDSEKDLQNYITSDLFVKGVPAKWNCKPEFIILEPGPILSKKIVTQPEDSWLSEK